MIVKRAEELGYFLKKLERTREEVAGQVAEELDVEFSVVLGDLETERATRKVTKKERKAKEVKPDNRPLSASIDNVAQVEKVYPKGKYLLTVAQNNTDVDAEALTILRQFAEHNDCKILCARMTYNKNAFQQGLDAEEVYYAPELREYMTDGMVDLGGVMFFADANVIPTAHNPLTGFAGAGNGRHVIVPASKMALQCVPSLKGRDVRQLWATGSVTKRNYILRKAGAVAALEHNIGAIFVDTTGESAVIRNLEIMPQSGKLCDITGTYTPEGILEPECAACFQPGDIHAEKMTDENLQALYGLLNEYQPEALLLHDVLDFESRNHHNKKDSLFIFKQATTCGTVRDNLEKMRNTVNYLSRYSGTTYIVKSNHDTALDRWLTEDDYRDDPVNALIFLELQHARYKAISEGRNYDALRDCQKYDDNVTFLALDESLILSGVEHGEHGHNGANGARGSIQSFRKLGQAMNTGHTHSPAICGKVYTAGVSASLEMGYNVGASSWAIAHTVTWANGQRQIIFA